MTVYSCIIVEDEPKLQTVLREYIAQVPMLRLDAVCNNAFEAMKALRETRADILFLDIKMPQFSGLQLLKTLDYPIKTIITTAYAEFAVDGFEVGVTDYLLKPISFERFMKAVYRALPHTATANAAEAAPPPATPSFIFVKVDRKAEKVMLAEILYLEGYGNYVKIFCAQRMLLVADTLTNLLALLPPQRFCKISKSYIVALDKIESFSGEAAQVQGRSIPVGKLYRNEFLQRMKGVRRG